MLALLALVGVACSSKHPPSKPQASAPSASARPLPVDHLLPDELAPSKIEVYGFPVPVGMNVENRLLDRAYISGHVSPEALANYVREQVVVSHVEIGAAMTVFPAARIKAGAADKVYSLEVLPDGPRTRLVIKDVTPIPAPPPGMTDAERWRAAGLSPDGRPLDLRKLE